MTKGEIVDLLDGDLKGQILDLLDGDLHCLAMRDEDVALAVCGLAGLIARTDKALRGVLEREMKPEPAWSESNLMWLWMLYANALKAEGGNHKKARRRTIKSWESFTGDVLTDRHLDNLLSRPCSIIDQLPTKSITGEGPFSGAIDFLKTEYKKRRERGEKTKHRGNWE